MTFPAPRGRGPVPEHWNRLRNALLASTAVAVLASVPVVSAEPQAPGLDPLVPSIQMQRSASHKVAHAHLSTRQMILRKFGPDGPAAVVVAECESTFQAPSPHHGINAVNGQYVGIGQEGVNERRKYGWYVKGAPAAVQIQTFFNHFVAVHRIWYPTWSCGWPFRRSK